MKASRLAAAAALLTFAAPSAAQTLPAPEQPAASNALPDAPRTRSKKHIDDPSQNVLTPLNPAPAVAPIEMNDLERCMSDEYIANNPGAFVAGRTDQGSLRIYRPMGEGLTGQIVINRGFGISAVMTPFGNAVASGLWNEAPLVEGNFVEAGRTFEEPAKDLAGTTYELIGLIHTKCAGPEPQGEPIPARPFQPMRYENV